MPKQEIDGPKKDRTNAIVVFAGLIALIPTVVSAWGMLGVFLDMGLPEPLSYGTSFFLEGLLISMALLSRRAIIHNRTAKTEMALTWLASLLSGMLSAAHEFVGPGGHYVTPTLMTWLAVAVRLIAPLAAALLWHRVLVADEMDAMPEVPRHERRTQHALFNAVCDAHEAQTTTGKEQELAASRFRKSWRQAVESSLTHWDREQLTATTQEWVRSLRYGDEVLLSSFDEGQTIKLRQIPVNGSAEKSAPSVEQAVSRTPELQAATTVPWEGSEDTAIFTNPFADLPEELLQPQPTPKPPLESSTSKPSRPTATGRDLRIAALVVSRRGGGPKDLAKELDSRGFGAPSNSTLRRALNRAATEG